MLTLVRPEDPILLRKAEPITFPLSAAIRKLATDMLPMMLQNRGCGLAAPQIGESVRLFTFFHGNVLGTVINPVILSRNPNAIEFTEGCLTYPGRRWNTKRSPSIRVRYDDIHGTHHISDLSDFMAIIFQHEIDHLDGILISQHGVEADG